MRVRRSSTGPVDICGQDASVGPNGCRDEDPAEDRQRVAVARARERPVARDGTDPDGQAPLRQLVDCCHPAALANRPGRGRYIRLYGFES